MPWELQFLRRLTRGSTTAHGSQRCLAQSYSHRSAGAPSQQGDPPGAMPASERLIPNRGEERGSHSSQHSTFHQQTPCQGSGNHSSSGHGAAWAAAPKAVPLWGELQQGGRSQALSPQEGAYRLGALPGLLRRVSGGFPASQLSSDPIISQYIFKNKSRVA